MDPSTTPPANPPLKGPQLQPLPNDAKTEAEKYYGQTGADAAADIIRKKLENLYVDEPAAKQELAEAEAAGPHRSKHQAYMHKLSSSGISLADIQVKWHEYYNKLSDHEKHQVWQEFYQHQEAIRQTPKSEPAPAPVHHTTTKQPKKRSARTQTAADIKRTLLGNVQSQNRRSLKAKHHLQSLAFGLGLGILVMLVFLFGFFNERFIAPFITPSRNVSATPIISDPTNATVGQDPKVIIPKINVEVPVVYDEPSVEEHAVQKALERGTMHYATTPKPGEQGNAAIFGHSSNNILNSGKYKFAFVLLNRLEVGDLFYINYNGVRYSYRVFEKKIVKPTDTWILAATDKPATASLITCDPPGTSLNRLVVFGEQISPDPVQNTASTAVAADQQPTIVPGNAPSLWQRITDLFTN
jgi:sortase A